MVSRVSRHELWNLNLRVLNLKLPSLPDFKFNCSFFFLLISFLRCLHSTQQETKNLPNFLKSKKNILAKILPCDRNNKCGPFGKCENLKFNGQDDQNSYKCHCNAGYEGVHCEDRKLFYYTCTRPLPELERMFLLSHSYEILNQYL